MSFNGILFYHAETSILHLIKSCGLDSKFRAGPLGKPVSTLKKPSGLIIHKDKRLNWFFLQANQDHSICLCGRVREGLQRE